MFSSRSAVLAATLSTTALLATGVALLAVPAHADPLTCQGRAVTVEGSVGTEGDDVMVVGGPGQRSADAGAGNDLVCIRLGDDLRASFFLGAGPGDDVVHHETAVSTRSVSVSLGTGADTFVGSDNRESVSTGVDTWGGTGDTEKDVVDTRGGNDSVFTGSVAPGTPNPDVISTGPGDDGVTWAGEQVGAPMDLGPGENRLTLASGWAGDDVDIDATAGVVTVGSRPVLRWTGDVTDYWLQYTHLRTSFTGTGLDEYLTFWPSQADQAGPPSTVSDPQLRLDADLGAGDDRLVMLNAAGGSWVGGRGQDRLGMPRCQVADVRVGTGYTCEDESRARTPYSGALDAWESVSAPGGRIRVIGTNGPDTIRVHGRTAYVDGRGGRDVLTSSGARTARASRVPVVVKGGSGADKIRGGYSNERLVGGPGDDRILGGPGEDRIVGGPGRDLALGQGGRDRCSAEIRRTCER